MPRQQKLFPEFNSPTSELAGICEAFFKKFKLERSPKSLDDVYAAFDTLRKGINSGDFEASLIGKFIFENITREDIRKRRVTAHDFEEFLTTFFEGEIIETEEQRRAYLKELPGKDEFSRRVSRNRLEKPDVRLGSLLFSVKTFVPTNLELNAGSFSAEALFEDFLPLPIPNERTDLGSPRALEEKFLAIAQQGKWNEFAKRFSTMVNIIYQTDWIFAIKGGKHLDVFILDGNTFRELMIEYVTRGPSQAVELLNRFEAHAIRTKLEPFLSESRHVSIDLIGPGYSKLRSVDNLISDIKLCLMTSLRGGFCADKVRQEILEKIEQFFKKIEYKA